MRAVLIFSRKLGEALARGGQLNDAEGVLREALVIAGPSGKDRAAVLGALVALVVLGTLDVWQGQFDLAEQWLTRAGRAFRPELDPATALELEASLVLSFSGQARASARIIAEQARNLDTDDAAALEGMHRLKEGVAAMREYLDRMWGAALAAFATAVEAEETAE